MTWNNPRLDWTKDDYYNAVDMNRVEGNTQEVASLILQLMGINVNLEPPVLDRDYSSIEFADSLNRVERNLSKLSVFNISGLTTFKTNWVVGDKFNYRDAIRLENNLSLLYPILYRNSTNVIQCGDIICGEGVM